jgi:hypothetical protein
MTFAIFIRAGRGEPISRFLGCVDADDADDAKGTARIAFGYDPCERYPNCVLVTFEVQTLHLVRQLVFVSVKTSPGKWENEGAISRNASWIYVNAVEGSDFCKRMIELKDALRDVEICPNSNKGAVMGNGSGGGYAIYARFSDLESAVEYIRLLGYRVNGNANF